VALSKGTFDEAVDIPPGVTLRGACAGLTRINASTSSGTYGVVTVRGDAVVLRSVGLSGERSGIVVDGGSLALDGVAVDGAREFGLVLRNGAHVTGEGLAVTATRASATGASGAGVGVFGGARLEVSRAVVASSLATGVWIAGAATSAHMTALTITDTTPQSDGRFGQGLDVSEGASVTVVESVLQRNVTGGVVLTHHGSSLVLRDAVVRDTARSTAGRLGRGVSVSEGAVAVLERVLIRQSAEAGVFVRGSGSSVSATHLVVADTRGADGDVIDGFGLGLEDGASADVQNALFANNQSAGVSARESTSIRLTDVVVRDTRSRALDGTLGQGIHIEVAAHFERVSLEGNRQVGLLIVGPAANADIHHLTIRGTRSQDSDGRFGRGLYVGDGGRAQIANALVEDNQESGIGAHGVGTMVALERVTVRATSSETASGQFGEGLIAQNGATVSVVTGRFERNREAGIASRGDGTTVQLVDVVVLATQERACVATSCPSAGVGVGLGAYSGGQLEARDFLVEESALAGVQLAEQGTMDLVNGVVRGNLIGANVQTVGFDIGRIQQNVQYLDNRHGNLDMRGLPLPEPSVEL
jgi:hypothetical protein